MIVHKTGAITTTPQSLGSFLGSFGPFTRVKFGGSAGVMIGDSSLDVSANQGIGISGSGLELEFDPDDDAGNNLYLVASFSTNITILAW